jgi:hypothetical protein
MLDNAGGYLQCTVGGPLHQWQQAHHRKTTLWKSIKCCLAIMK